METLLTLLGILGLGALLIALYIFAAAARRYVSGETTRKEQEAMDSDLSPYRSWQDRAETDRRRDSTAPVFPITVNGVRIESERRLTPDRRTTRRSYIERSGQDRRRLCGPVQFPLRWNGDFIATDRRSYRERRSA